MGKKDFGGSGDYYEVFQIKPDGKGAAYQYMGMESAAEKGAAIAAEDYEAVYADGFVINGGDSVEDVLEEICMELGIGELPEGFGGRQVTTSDVIVLHMDGRAAAYYVDDIGFAELPDFNGGREQREQEKEEDSIPGKDGGENGDPEAPAGRETAPADKTPAEERNPGSGAEEEPELPPLKNMPDGVWHVLEKKTVSGKEFAIRETEGQFPHGVVMECGGKVVMDNCFNGFDRTAMLYIRSFLEENGRTLAERIPLEEHFSVRADEGDYVIWDNYCNAMLSRDGKERRLPGFDEARHLCQSLNRECRSVYRHTAEYAGTHGEWDRMLRSEQETAICRNELEAAVRENFGTGKVKTGFVKPLMARFGAERIEFVLANTIVRDREAGRYREGIRRWAESVPLKEEGTADRSASSIATLECTPQQVMVLTSLVLQEVQEAKNLPEQKENEREKAADREPYCKPRLHALRHGEADLWKKAFDGLRECKGAIEEAIRRDFDGEYLYSDAPSRVIEQYGAGMVETVLANTVRFIGTDRRICEANRSWAAQIPAVEGEYGNINQAALLTVDAHPAVLDGFISLVRLMSLERDIGQEIAAEPAMSYFVVESDSFPFQGEYKEGLTLDEAVRMYGELPDSRFTGEKAIGITLAGGGGGTLQTVLVEGGVFLEGNAEEIRKEAGGGKADGLIDGLRDACRKGRITQAGRESPPAGKNMQSGAVPAEAMKAEQDAKPQRAATVTPIHTRKAGRKQPAATKESILEQLRRHKAQTAADVPDAPQRVPRQAAL
ncbi:MAG: DUF3849 domain-containing protein [Lachnospiraceae bacterium]|nr:DUF3849 domain-containing protein [Lachnospiraceae bacterium]